MEEARLQIRAVATAAEGLWAGLWFCGPDLNLKEGIPWTTPFVREEECNEEVQALCLLPDTCLQEISVHLQSWTHSLECLLVSHFSISFLHTVKYPQIRYR